MSILPATGPGASENIARAAEVLRSDGLVVLPTDTVYGLAADAFSPLATRRIFELKRRARSFPLPVLVRTPKQVAGLVTRLPQAAERLMAAYWPGALTLVVAAEPNLAWDLGETDGTVSVRMPFDDVALDVIRAVGPLAVTAANLAGNPPATDIRSAVDQLRDEVGVYLDAGPRRGRPLSTIVDLTRAEPRVLRVGPVPPDEALAVARGELDPMSVTPPEPPPPPSASSPDADRRRLLAIPGLGPARADALLAAFGSVTGVAAAEPDRLATIRGIGPSLAARVAEHLQGRS